MATSESDAQKNLTKMETKSMEKSNDMLAITVIGSGDFGRGLALRMVQCGYNVYIGSRNPNGITKSLVENIGAKIMKTEDAIKKSQMIVMAVPKDFYDTQPLHLLEGKTVIDCSNRSTVHRKMEQSQAEYLESLLPTSSKVVKAFNVLSAYSLESGGIQGTKEVFFAGDDQKAKEEVSGLIHFLGFTPVDRGALRNSRQIEDIPVQRFANWKHPLIISLIVFLWFFLIGFGDKNICRVWPEPHHHENVTKWEWWIFWETVEAIPLNNLNLYLAQHALSLLALCYLPGCLAAYIQLFRGTKYSRFPKILDRWLKMRKQLGLLMLLSASLHACMSMGMLDHFRHKGWQSESFYTAGAVCFGLAIILGITSLPSVTDVLTWKEFAFVQSKMGWLCLVFGTTHDLLLGWDHILEVECGFFLKGTMYAIWIPGLTLILKFPLLIPPVDWYLTKIRGGWSRGIEKYSHSAQIIGA